MGNLDAEAHACDDDRILVMRFQQGDQDAFAHLYRQHHRALLYFLAKSLGDMELARDAAQETWLKAYRKLSTLRTPSAFRCWLYAVGRREALMALRRRSAQREAPLPDEPWEGEEVEMPEYRPEEAERLDRALDGLPHRHREVLVLRFLHEMSYAEIAAVVDCNLGTVRSRLHYAGKALRRLLEGVADVEAGIEDACETGMRREGGREHVSE